MTQLAPRNKTAATTDLPAELAALSELETSALRAELSRQLELTADHLRRLAWIVRILEGRGEDLSELRFGLLPYVRQIAHDQVAPEAVVRFGRSPLTLQMISSLPLPDQKRLAKGEPVKLILAGQGGVYTHRMVDPSTLGRDQLRQVFGREGIRDEAEQIGYLEEKGAPKPPKPGIEKHGRIKIDRTKKVLRIGRITLEPAQVIEALARLNSADEDSDHETDEEKKQLPIQVTASEEQALRVAAAKAGLRSPAALVRRSLIALGLME